MRENTLRVVEAFIAIASSYLAAVTMVQTTLYTKIVDKIVNYFGPESLAYVPYLNLGLVALAVFVAFSFWRKGDEVGFGRLFNLNMLMFFPAVLDFSTFNWVGLIFNLTPIGEVSDVWVFSVGLFLQITYLMLRYTVRFRYTRDELEGRGATYEDIDNVTGGQFRYLSMLLIITGGTTSIVFLAIPYLNRYMETKLNQIPGMHWAVGLSVVILLAMSLVYYLRSQED